MLFSMLFIGQFVNPVNVSEGGDGGNRNFSILKFHLIIVHDNLV